MNLFYKNNGIVPVREFAKKWRKADRYYFFDESHYVISYIKNVLTTFLVNDTMTIQNMTKKVVKMQIKHVRRELAAILTGDV